MMKSSATISMYPSWTWSTLYWLRVNADTRTTINRNTKILCRTITMTRRSVAEESVTLWCQWSAQPSSPRTKLCWCSPAHVPNWRTWRTPGYGRPRPKNRGRARKKVIWTGGLLFRRQSSKQARLQAADGRGADTCPRFGRVWNRPGACSAAAAADGNNGQQKHGRAPRAEEHQTRRRRK